MTETTKDPKAETLALLRSIDDGIEANNILLTAINDRLESLAQLGGNLAEALALLRNPINNQPAPTSAQPAGDYTEFTAEAIIMTYNDKGEPAYKAIGYPYTRYGVRVWPETLPILGIDPQALKPGPNPYSARVIALMGEHGPKKVVNMVAETPQQAKTQRPPKAANSQPPEPEYIDDDPTDLRYEGEEPPF